MDGWSKVGLRPLSPQRKRSYRVYLPWQHPIARDNGEHGGKRDTGKGITIERHPWQPTPAKASPRWLPGTPPPRWRGGKGATSVCCQRWPPGIGPLSSMESVTCKETDQSQVFVTYRERLVSGICHLQRKRCGSGCMYPRNSAELLLNHNLHIRK